MGRGAAFFAIGGGTGFTAAAGWGGAAIPTAGAAIGAPTSCTLIMGGAGGCAPGREKMNAATSPPWRRTDMMKPPLNRGSRTSAITLFDFLRLGHQSDLPNARRIHDGEQLHHQPIIDAAIRSEIHTGLRAVRRDGLEGYSELAERHLLIVEPDLARAIDRYDEPALRLQWPRLGL